MEELFNEQELKKGKTSCQPLTQIPQYTSEQYCDDILDILISTIQWAINSTHSELTKNKLQKWLDALQKMKEMEEKSRLEDEKDLAELENMLENI